MPLPPPITRGFLIACLAAFILEHIPALRMVPAFALFPLESGLFMPWQLVTYAFLHNDFSHLFFNMLALWMFGVELELLWGARRYVQFLLAGAVTAGVTFLVLSSLLETFSPIAGASGAIFGMLLAFGMLFPHRPILFFMVYPTTMRTAVLLFGGLELIFMLTSGFASIASNVAHLGGMLGGWLMILYWRRRPPSFRRGR